MVNGLMLELIFLHRHAVTEKLSFEGNYEFTMFIRK